MRGNLQLNTTPATTINGQRFYLILNPVDNPFFARFRWRINDGTSDYNGLRLSLTKRFGRGFQLQSSYTWSKSIDDGSAYLGSGDFSNDRQPYRTTKEKALSSFDIRNSFNTNFVYDLPKKVFDPLASKFLGGWSLSGILRFNSGDPNAVSGTQPQSVVGGTTTSLTFVDGAVVNLVPNGKLNPTSGTSAGCSSGTGAIASGARLGTPTLSDPNRLYFDPCQFSFPQSNCLRGTAGATATFPCDPSQPAGLYAGNVGPSTLIGPGIANFDFTLTKNTAVPVLGEKGNLEFRFELYNLFNRVIQRSQQYLGVR
jgi:hypothetical protein